MPILHLGLFCFLLSGLVQSLPVPEGAGLPSRTSPLLQVLGTVDKVLHGALHGGGGGVVRAHLTINIKGIELIKFPLQQNLRYMWLLL